MSTKSKKVAPTGVRYTDAQKREVVDFVSQYNAQNGRGGQSAASKKFKITQLTIAAWIKALGGKGGKSKSVAKAASVVKEASAGKPAKFPKPTGKSTRGMRYTPSQKAEVVDFVNSYNSANGRGGQSQAAKRYGLSVLTVASWLRNAGTRSGGRPAAGAASKAAVSSALTSKVVSLISLSDQIRKAEAELQSLRSKYDTLRSAIQAAI